MSMAAINRRTFLKGAASAMVAGVAAASADATIFQPNSPILKRVEIRLRRLPPVFDGFTIAQLSDFHYDKHFSHIPIQRGIEISNALKPDMVVLTGDFVTQPALHHYLHNSRQGAKAAEPCAALLTQVRARQGVFAILGNHDANTDPEFVTECLESRGIPVLANRSLAIERGGSRFWLCGTRDNPRDSDLQATLLGLPVEEAKIVLIHEPDCAEYTVRHAVDLQLSGHSHGGQVRLPIIGPVYLPDRGIWYPRGLRLIRNLTLYTNVGLGTIGPPVRWNCPPEVTLFTLRSGAAI
jgi:predicted MPP superfamily phosphohydrolase